MPTWILVVCAVAGGVLILGEVLIRVLVSLIPTETTNTAKLVNEGRLSKIAAAVGQIESDITSSATDDPAQVKRMRDALVAVKASVEGFVATVSRAEQIDGSFLAGALNSVVRQNVFLGLGALLLLVPALIAGGFNVGFDRLPPTSTTAPSDDPNG